MNFRLVLNMLGKILLIMAALMLLPAVVSVCSGGTDLLAILASAAITAAVGGGMLLLKPKDTTFFAKEGFVVVALAWVVMSLLGALPFMFGGVFTNYMDAVFETASGFTTTGATVLSGGISAIPHGIGFWRCFIIFIGGMGVLVFVMAVLPLSKERSMYLMRAEVPGPSVGKLVAKAKDTALILYSIYFALMVLMAVMLLFGGMNVYEAFTTALSTAGTGGFMVYDAGFIGLSPYLQTVTTVFMLLFAVNFNLYYYILMRRIGDVTHNEELRWFLGIFFAAVLTMTVANIGQFGSFGESLHHTAFNAASVYSTTGFASVDFDKWPTISKCVMLLLMVCGGCTGSTAGGIKTSRVAILVKNAFNELRRFAHPKYVRSLKLDGKVVSEPVVRSVTVYFSVIIGIIIVSIILVSANGFDFESSLSAVFACIFNIGPGFHAFGPTASFAPLSNFSKLVLTFDMLAGRLELWPLLLLFVPSTWKKRAVYK